jgi:hypothetical protein
VGHYKENKKMSGYTEEEVLQSYKGRCICAEKELGNGYVGGCGIEIHRSQMADPSSWVHASVSKWIEEELYTVDATHTDPTQQETALCLKYRHRARTAEAASKIDSECNVIMQKALGAIAGQKISEYDSCQPVAAGSLTMASKALEDCKVITDSQLEDVLMLDKEGDE